MGEISSQLMWQLHPYHFYYLLTARSRFVAEVAFCIVLWLSEVVFGHKEMKLVLSVFTCS